MPGDLKILGQDTGAIFPARENLLRDANVACCFRDVKSTGFPSALTIDASVFTDQLKPEARSGGERRETLKASILVEKRKRDITEEQQVEERVEDESKDDKKTPRAADYVRASETCGEEKIKRQTCIDASANEELLARIEEISPTKLSEMINKEINNSIKEINNSIKDAVQTIVKQCSMEEKKPISPCSKESERKSRVCRFRVAEEHCEKSSNLSSSNRQTTCPALRKYNNPTHDSSFSRAKTHENTILLPMDTKINNEKKNKKHSKPANNVSADNRRMSGNVNIYICSEANDNSPDKSRRKSKSQSCTETSSDTITEKSNSRCASSASSCKLINCIQEKRRKLQAQRLSTPHKSRGKSSDSSENGVCDNNTTVHGICWKVPSESNKEPVSVKLSDEDVECEDTISSTRDGCCCEDTNSTTGPRCDSSDSVVPCTRSFSMFDNSVRPQSWTTVYPSKAEAESNSSDTSLNYDGNDARNNVRVRDGEYSACGAIDGNRWQRKSIYTDCSTYGKVPKECFADNCGYRNKKARDSAVNDNGIWKRGVGYKLWQPGAEGCRREHVILQRSACSCITEEKEEEEDRYASVDEVENELPKSVCEEATCPEKISVYRALSRELAGDAIVCGASFSAAGKCPEETRTCKSASEDPAACPNGAAVCVTTFGNSEEPPKVTRVCKELVAEESSEDIAVCRTMVFGEPKGPPEEVAASKAALPDSEGIPKETICKKISESNFADRGDVKEVSLNGAEDKLAVENTNSSNLNNRKENVGNTERAEQLNNKYGSRDNFAGWKFAGNIKRDKQTKTIVPSKESNTRNIPVRQTEDFITLPKSIYSTIPRNSTTLTSNPKANEISNTHSDQQGSLKFQPPNRPLRNYLRQSSGITKRSTMRDLASHTNNRTGEKARGESKEDEEKRDIPKEAEIKDVQPRESLLHRSIKKLTDILKYTREQLKAKRETKKTEKTELREKLADDKRDPAEFKTISETADKIIDEKDQELVEQIEAPRSPLADEEISRKTAKPESIVADFGVSKKDKKTDVPEMDEMTRKKPKLFRIIAAKKLRIPTAADSKPQEPEVESVRVVTDSREPEAESPIVETITSDRVDQEKTFQEETIAQEPIFEETQEEKMEESIVSKISITEIKEVPTKDVADIPKGIPDKEEVLKDAIDESTQIYTLLPDEKQREDFHTSISCKCGVSPESNGSYLIAKRAKLYVPCPQKQTKEEPKKTIPCTSTLSFHAKCCSCLSYTQRDKILKECLCKDKERIDQCAPPQYLKSCLKTSQKFDKPKFRSVSPSKISSHVCPNCCKMKEECVCKKTAFSCQPREECKCGWCATPVDYSRTADKLRPRDQCSCTFSECNKITRVCNCRKAMICLYCDNPRDKCTCRAPIGKCPSCGIPLDVCNCQVDIDRDRKQINERPDENRTIRVTSWKPRRDVRRYFTRNSEDFQSNSTEECRCYEKPNGQHTPEEQLPYQRLDIFSDVMNELQRKISESICCTRCWRNPCCCELRASQVKEGEEKTLKDHARSPELEKSPRSRLRNKSPNNCRYNSSPKTKRKHIAEKSIPMRRTGCELSPCRCRRNRPNNKRPLAKCYYCKSLPCA